MTRTRDLVTAYQNEIPVNQGAVEEGMSPWRIEDEIGEGAADDCDVAQCHCDLGIETW